MSVTTEGFIYLFIFLGGTAIRHNNNTGGVSLIDEWWDIKIWLELLCFAVGNHTHDSNH